MSEDSKGRSRETRRRTRRREDDDAVPAEGAVEREPGYGVEVRARELPPKALVRRKRRKPRAKRQVAELVSTGPSGKQTFKDPDLKRLRDRGWFDELEGVIKGGKEATVYLVTRGETPLAAKVYADLEARSFRNDAPYWEGLKFEDERLERALMRRSRTGRKAQVALWVMREYANLWRLHQAGVRVPVPALPAEPSAWATAGAVVLMEYVGEEGEPAPRLADIKLEPEEANSAYAQAAQIAVELAGLGLVHGDLSTYNLLWHRGEVVLIDLPQMMDVRVGAAATQLLDRDLETLTRSFRALGAEVDEDALRQRVEAALPPAPPPGAPIEPHRFG